MSDEHPRKAEGVRHTEEEEIDRRDAAAPVRQLAERLERVRCGGHSSLGFWGQNRGRTHLCYCELCRLAICDNHLGELLHCAKRLMPIFSLHILHNPAMSVLSPFYTMKKKSCL